MQDFNEIKKCCFTGYRPAKFPFKLDKKDSEYRKFENNLMNNIVNLIKNENCLVFYTGMAMGFDIIAAEIVLLLKKSCKDINIKLYCVLPFLQQQMNFNDIWQKRYKNIINKCDKTIVMSEDYYTGCYQKRNRYMVDNSDYVMTWFDGKMGGTRNTINYAVKNQKYVFNINHEYKSNINQNQFSINFD